MPEIIPKLCLAGVFKSVSFLSFTNQAYVLASALEGPPTGLATDLLAYFDDSPTRSVGPRGEREKEGQKEGLGATGVVSRGRTDMRGKTMDGHIPHQPGHDHCLDLSWCRAGSRPWP